MIRRPHSEAFIAALARLDLLVEQTVPRERRIEISRAVAKFTAAAVRDDRASRAAQAVEGESRAVLDEIFGVGGVFERIFGTMGGRR